MNLSLYINRFIKLKGGCNKLTEFLSKLSDIVWGPPTLILIVGTGLFSNVAYWLLSV